MSGHEEKTTIVDVTGDVDGAVIADNDGEAAIYVSWDCLGHYNAVSIETNGDVILDLAGIAALRAALDKADAAYVARTKEPISGRDNISLPTPEEIAEAHEFIGDISEIHETFTLNYHGLKALRVLMAATRPVESKPPHRGESGHALSLPVRVDVSNLCGPPARVAKQLRALANDVEAGARLESYACGCTVKVAGQ
jgi:hypothetical protein